MTKPSSADGQDRQAPRSGGVGGADLADVLVVGAGPGGASAAYHLARGGASVILAGGGPAEVTPEAGCALSVLARDCLLGMELGPWAEGLPSCRRVVLGGPRGSLAGHDTLRDRAAPALTTESDLRSALLGAARTAGVRVEPAMRVASIEWRDDAVVARTAAEGVAARLLVLAEGGEALLAARADLVHREPEYVTASATYAHDGDQVFEIHYLPETLPCLAWGVPAGPGKVTLGVAAYSSAVKDGRVEPRAVLAGFAARRAYGGLAATRPLGEVRVSPVRSGLDSVTPFAERMLLAGEAAGVVHPLTLEGLGAAMESGRIAAQHFLYALEKQRFSADDLSAYAKALRRRFAIEHRPAKALRALIHSERVIERIVGRAQWDDGFAALLSSLYLGGQSTLGALTPANLSRYVLWWRGSRSRSSKA